MSGRHFLQIPGPTNVPDRVLRAMARPTTDHRGPEFSSIALDVLDRVKAAFKTTDPVILFPSSGTGCWEAALANTLSPGDKVLMFETGQFATLWREVAVAFGLEVDFVPGDWRHGADPAVAEAKLTDDKSHAIKAVCVVHNETSNGVTSRLAEIRAAMDRADHPALFMVDAVSSLGSIDYRQDEWRVDVTTAGSQKGLMLPPGLGFNAVSEKALEANKTAKLPRFYWDWQTMLGLNGSGMFPFTPAINHIFGLAEALDMFEEEGWDNVYARHNRLAEATRCALAVWGLENACLNPEEYSSSLTAVLTPDGHSADELRKVILDNFDMSLGAGLGKVAGKLFRIGHMGHFNELMLTGTLCGVEMGLGLAGVPHEKGGVDAAMAYLANGKSAAAVAA